MRLITRVVAFDLRNVRPRRQHREQVEDLGQQPSFQKIKFTEEQLTQMGQYKMRSKSRHYKDIFRDKMEEQMEQEYIKKQKKDMFAEEDLEPQNFSRGKAAPTMERTSAQQKRQQHRTFKIYKHIDRFNQLREEGKKRSEESTDMITEEGKLTQLSRVRINEQYLPYQYMKNVQKIFHKYDQTKLRDIAFHFTNLMRLRYNEEKIDYDQYPGLQFQRLEDKLPFHRKVQQIYLTSKEKAMEVREEETKKVEDQPDQIQIKYTQNIVVSYLLNRVPRTYSVAFRVMNEVKKMFNGYKPSSFIDFGAGLSTGSAAFVEHFGDTGSVYSVEPASKMRKVAKFLTTYSKIIQYQSLAELSSQVKQVDMVYCGYVLNQLKPDIVTVYLQALFAKVKPQGFLILTQYGNPFGSRIIHQSRRWALTKNIRIVAPCPHHLKCPLSSSKHWCHFDQPSGMLPRQVFGKLPSENTVKNQKFSYIIIQKLEDEQGVDSNLPPAPQMEPNESHQWDRVIFPLMRKGGHFVYTLCTKKGKFQKRRSAKSHGQEYKSGRKLRWGDLWRFGFRIPNRYRKERTTGKRLW